MHPQLNEKLMGQVYSDLNRLATREVQIEQLLQENEKMGVSRGRGPQLVFDRCCSGDDNKFEPISIDNGIFLTTMPLLTGVQEMTIKLNQFLADVQVGIASDLTTQHRNCDCHNYYWLQSTELVCMWPNTGCWPMDGGLLTRLHPCFYCQCVLHLLSPAPCLRSSKLLLYDSKSAFLDCIIWEISHLPLILK